MTTYNIQLDFDVHKLKLLRDAKGVQEDETECLQRLVLEALHAKRKSYSTADPIVTECVELACNNADDFVKPPQRAKMMEALRQGYLKLASCYQKDPAKKGKIADMFSLATHGRKLDTPIKTVEESLGVQGPPTFSPANESYDSTAEIRERAIRDSLEWFRPLEDMSLMDYVRFRPIPLLKCIVATEAHIVLVTGFDVDVEWAINPTAKTQLSWFINETLPHEYHGSISKPPVLWPRDKKYGEDSKRWKHVIMQEEVLLFRGVVHSPRTGFDVARAYAYLSSSSSEVKECDVIEYCARATAANIGVPTNVIKDLEDAKEEKRSRP